MASSKKRSKKNSRSTTSKAKAVKPSAAKGLQKTAGKQGNAVARGGAGQEKTRKTDSGPQRSTVSNAKPGKTGPIKRVASAVSSAAKKVASALKPGKGKKTAPAAASARAKTESQPATSRKPRRTSDVDATKLDDIRAGQASSKAPFDQKRSDAFAKQDIESALATSNEEWGEENHLTNKTGNKRIGTRGRTYQ